MENVKLCREEILILSQTQLLLTTTTTIRKWYKICWIIVRQDCNMDPLNNVIRYPTSIIWKL